MQKIINGLAVASFVLVIGTVGTGAYSYYWITSNQDKLMGIVIDKVKDQVLPKMPGTSLPKKTGSVLPF